MATITVPRIYGGVIVLVITPPVPPATNVALFVRSGVAVAKVRSGKAGATVRSGVAAVKVREQ